MPSVSSSNHAGSTPASETIRVSEHERAALVAPGSMLARYVVLEEIGEGGMGRVLRAYDPKLEREVALKQVLFGARDDETQADKTAQRLVREARAMAKVSHRNVVAVYDVERLPSGEVIVVMEYIDGPTLKAWVRAESPGWPAIVARYVDAGRGLAAAHQAGLLHRDFKPANVLIAGEVVKVTDFGLAKLGRSISLPASSDVDPDTADLTETGSVMGTPRYMAPEQFDPAPGRERGDGYSHLTPASDQYAFCVALWEALCGKAPFSGSAMVGDKLVGPPTWPNGAVPRRVSDAIIRGLSVDPNDRWPSMDALLEVLAQDPRQRRTRWVVGLAGMTVVGLGGVWASQSERRCTGAAAQLSGAWDEARRTEVRDAMLAVDRPYAEQAWKRADAALQRYAEDWVAMHEDSCRATAIRGEQSSDVLDLRMMCLRAAAVELDAATQLLTEADPSVVSKAHEVVASLQPLSRCADLTALTSTAAPADPDDVPRVEAAQLELARAKSLIAAGRFDDAHDAIEAARAALGNAIHAPLLAALAVEEGDVLENLGDYDAAISVLEDGLEWAGKARRWDLFGKAARLLTFVIGARQQRPEVAEPFRRIAAGAPRSERDEVQWRNVLGALALLQGQFVEAEAEFRAALDVAEAILEPDAPQLARLRNNIGMALLERGRFAEAEAQQRTSLALRTKALGPHHPDTVMSRSSLGMTLERQGRYAEAEAEHRAAIELFTASLGPKHLEVAQSRNNLGNALASQGNTAEAEQQYREALAIREAALGPDHVLVATCRQNIGSALADLGKPAEAEAEYRAAIEGYTRTYGREHPRVLVAELNLGELLLELQRTAEAITVLSRIQPLMERPGLPPGPAAAATFALARGFWDADEPKRDRVRARRLAEDARRSFADTYPDRREAVEAWLRAHPAD